MAQKSTSRTLKLTAIRKHFPALKQMVNGVRPVYLDNPGGTQVTSGVIDALRDYLIRANSNTHGMFHTSHETDRTIDAGRAAMADFLNAPHPEQIIFGANMTTLTFSMSRAIGQVLPKGSEIIVTRMDHDANVSPWLLLARDLGFKIVWADWNPETGRLDVESIGKLIGKKTKLIACSYASNALGTINDMKRITQMAHEAGAWSYIDAVQYAPHGPIDVQDIDCDFLACSAYKFFGPHVGILYGKQEHLTNLPAYKVRPSPDKGADRWETGTKNHEGIAGTKAAIDYFAWIGETYGEPFAAQSKGYRGRKRTLKQAMYAIKAYEQSLSKRLIEGLGAIKNVTVGGITDTKALDERVPTVIFNIKGMKPAQVAEDLGNKGIYVWDGNYYALEVMERMGLEAKGGMVRVGAVHYNTRAEIDRFLREVDAIAKGKSAKVPVKAASKNGKAKKTAKVKEAVG